MIDQSEIGNSSQIIFVALFSGQVHISAGRFTNLSTLSLGQNHFADSKWHVLTLLYPV
jgi:hypothetical protein